MYCRCCMYPVSRVDTNLKTTRKINQNASSVDGSPRRDGHRARNAVPTGPKARTACRVVFRGPQRIQSRTNRLRQLIVLEQPISTYCTSSEYCTTYTALLQHHGTVLPFFSAEGCPLISCISLPTSCDTAQQGYLELAAYIYMTKLPGTSRSTEKKMQRLEKVAVKCGRFTSAFRKPCQAFLLLVVPSIQLPAASQV